MNHGYEDNFCRLVCWWESNESFYIYSIILWNPFFQSCINKNIQKSQCIPHYFFVLRQDGLFNIDKILRLESKNKKNYKNIWDWNSPYSQLSASWNMSLFAISYRYQRIRTIFIIYICIYGISFNSFLSFHFLWTTHLNHIYFILSMFQWKCKNWIISNVIRLVDNKMSF